MVSILSFQNFNFGLNFSFSFWVKSHSLTSFTIVDGVCSWVSMRDGGGRIGDRRWSTIIDGS